MRVPSRPRSHLKQDSLRTGHPRVKHNERKQQSLADCVAAGMLACHQQAGLCWQMEEV